MAVILDGNVYSAPVIQARIGGGRAQITLGTGGYNALLKEARDLALVLGAGALPVQLDFLEQRTVGPSLGEDSIVSARFAGSCWLYPRLPFHSLLLQSFGDDRHRLPWHLISFSFLLAL